MLNKTDLSTMNVMHCVTLLAAALREAQRAGI